MGFNSRAQTQPRTFESQKQLPRVPLPTLDDSCSIFLEWCNPLLSSKKQKITICAVEKFAHKEGPGRKLHSNLVKYESIPGVESWLDDFWQTRYLGRRDPIALNANFFFLFPDRPCSQVQRAAEIITAVLHYKIQLDIERIPVEMLRDRPLCMIQNRNLFSTTRIPGYHQDTLRSPCNVTQPCHSQASHILVFHKGNMFVLETLGPSGIPHSIEDYENGIRTIMQIGCNRAEAGESVGHLTTSARSNWAGIRQALIEYNSDNMNVLNKIETALFAVCLDDFNPETHLVASNHLLHGDSANRWFDKSIQFIIFENGSSGINVEHSGLDASTISYFVNALHTYDSSMADKESGARTQGLPFIRSLNFKLNDSLKAHIRHAADSFSALAENTATTVVDFNNFGASQIKKLAISPDAFIHLCLQLANYRVKGVVGTTYESINTRQYSHGRTEAMRVITPEIVRFVETMQSTIHTDNSKNIALRLAAEKHVARIGQCKAGLAPEQHLWELLNIYWRHGADLGIDEKPALYETPGWLMLRNDALSTSSVTLENCLSTGFGPTSAQCIGVAYMIKEEQIHAYLTTPKEASGKMYQFVDQLRNAYIEIAALLETNM